MGRGHAGPEDQPGGAQPVTALPWLSYMSGGGKGFASGVGDVHMATSE